MAIRDHQTRVAKLRVTIVTVDPTQRLIEAVAQDGAVRRLATFDAPNNFRWPREGEQWSIYEENGYWTLGNQFEVDPDAQSIEDFGVGDGPGTKKFVATLGDGVSTAFTIRHGLGTYDFTYLLRTNDTLPYEPIFPDVLDQIIDRDTVHFTFAVAPAQDYVRLTIIG